MPIIIRGYGCCPLAVAAGWAGRCGAPGRSFAGCGFLRARGCFPPQGFCRHARRLGG